MVVVGYGLFFGGGGGVFKTEIKLLKKIEDSI